MTEREQIVEVVNKLFIYTDYQQWKELQSEVFAEKVHLDMSSMGGSAEELSSKAICDMWAEGFEDIDEVNHLAGNYLVTFKGDDEANVFAYSTATHYRENATKGTTRDFVGSYFLGLKKRADGWKIYSMTYKLKFASGNLTLK